MISITMISISEMITMYLSLHRFVGIFQCDFCLVNTNFVLIIATCLVFGIILDVLNNYLEIQKLGRMIIYMYNHTLT